jgi:hypothetical protein
MISTMNFKGTIPTFFLLATLSCVNMALVSGCDNKKDTAALDAQPNGGKPDQPPNRKTSVGLPSYDSSSFSVGQTWIWKQRKTSSQKVSCQRWQLLEVTSGGMSIEHRETQDCGTFENTNSRKYIVDLNTGEVLRIVYSDGTSASHPGFDIFPRLNGDDSTHPTTQKKIRLQNKEWDVVQAQGSKSWYFDAPDTAFHSVLFQDEKWELVFASK